MIQILTIIGILIATALLMAAMVHITTLLQGVTYTEFKQYFKK